MAHADVPSPTTEVLALHLRSARRGLTATLVSRLVDVGATYGYYSILARSLAPAEFGNLVVGMTALQFGAVIARRGLDQALLALPPGGPLNRLAFGRVAVASTALALAAAAGASVSGLPLPPLATWLVGGLPAVALAQMVISALRARGRITVAASAEGVAQPVAAFLLAGGVALAAPTVFNFALAFLVSWIAPLAFGLTLDWRGPRLGRGKAEKLMATGMQMLGTAVFQQGAAAVDVMLLGLLASTAEVARYAAAQKIAAVLLVLHGAVTAATSPLVRHVADDGPSLVAFRQTVTRWGVAAGLPLLAIAAGTPGLPLRVFGPEYVTHSAAATTFLSFAGLAYLLCGPASSILLCIGRAAALFRATAAGSIVLVVSVAALAPYGASAAAAGVLFGTLVTRVLLVVLLRRFAAIPLIDRASLALVLGGAASVLLTRVLGIALGEPVGAALGCAAAIFVALVVLGREGDLAFLRPSS